MKLVHILTRFECCTSLYRLDECWLISKLRIKILYRIICHFPFVLLVIYISRVVYYIILCTSLSGRANIVKICTKMF